MSLKLAVVGLSLILSTTFAQYYGGSYSSGSYGNTQGNPSSNNTDNNGLTGTVVAGNGNNTAVCAPIPQVFNLTGDDLYKTLLIYNNILNTEVHNISQANPGNVDGVYLNKIKALDAVLGANGSLAQSENASASQCVVLGQKVIAALNDVINASNDSIKGNCSTLTGDDYFHHIYQQNGAAAIAPSLIAANATNSPGQWLDFITNFGNVFRNFITVITGSNAEQGCHEAASQFNAMYRQELELGEQLKTGVLARSKESMLHNLP